MRRKKKRIVFVIILVLLFFGIGYAYLTTTLSINGITDIDRNSWDVYFDNVQVTTGSVSGAQEIEAPTITSDTEVEFHINLKQPGDYYEFTVDAKNDGTIDAMVESVSTKINGVEVSSLPNYLVYYVEYENGADVAESQLLAHESVETLLVRIEFRDDIEAGDLPSTAQSFNMSFDVTYIQAHSSAWQPITYTTFGIFSLRSDIPNTATVYYDRLDAMASPADLGYSHTIPFYFKNRMDHNRIIGSSLVLEISDELAQSVNGLESGVYNFYTGCSDWNEQKARVESIFGAQNCIDNSSSETCTFGQYSMYVHEDCDFSVYDNTNDYWCEYIDNTIKCAKGF